MRIALIVPRIAAYKPAGALEPLAMGIIAALTPRRHTLRLFDENVEAIDRSFQPDVVALSAHSFSARRAYDLADQYRQAGVTVVMGGVHPSLLPEEALRHADHVVVGDAEDTWPRVLTDLEQRTAERVYRSDLGAPLAPITPDRAIFAGKRYSRIAPVCLGRGCRFSCDFCSVHSMYGAAVRRRPLDAVLAEVAALRRRPLFFTDDNICAYGEHTRVALEGLQRLRVRWIGQMSVDNAADDELLRHLRRSGCLALLVGFESLSEANLTSIGKRQNRRTDYAAAVKRMQRHGIMVAGSFMFGCDDDRPGSVMRTLAFAQRTNLALAHFNPLYPVPATPLYARLVAEGRMTDPCWWTSPTYRYGDLPFTPKAVSAEALRSECYQARLRFNTLGSILRRALSAGANCLPPSHLALFIWANLFSRREIHAKQELALG